MNAVDLANLAGHWLECDEGFVVIPIALNTLPLYKAFFNPESKPEKVEPI
jgi:hypothetical protein